MKGWLFEKVKKMINLETDHVKKRRHKVSKSGMKESILLF